MIDSLGDVFRKIKENKLGKEEALDLIKKLRNKEIKKGQFDSLNSTADSRLVMFQPYWEEQVLLETSAIDYSQHQVVLIEKAGQWESIIQSQGVNASSTVILQSKETAVEQRFEQYTSQVYERLQHIFKSKPTGKVLFQVFIKEGQEEQLLEGLVGLLRTSRLENPTVVTQLIVVEKALSAINVNECSANFQDIYIKYTDGKRYVASWREMETLVDPAMPWREEGVYLITGGLGGLGELFAREIAHKVKQPNIILTGRSSITETTLEVCQSIESLGANLEYWRVDITNRQEAVKMFDNIKQRHSKLTGIIHSAGVIKDNYIIRKNLNDIKDVLAPKVSGLVNLDEGSRGFNLDFFALFSSGSGSTGNAGQADYAAASTFMDQYALYRNSQVKANHGYGQTISIDWPLWQDGGMTVDFETLKQLRNVRGMEAMKTSTGFNAFYQALASKQSQVMVIEGQLFKIREFLGHKTKPTSSKEQGELKNNAPKEIHDPIVAKLKALLAEVTKQNVTKIDAYEELENYGVESFMIARLNKKLALHFEELSKTLFYEYRTISSLATYLIKSHPDESAKWVTVEGSTIHHNQPVTHRKTSVYAERGKPSNQSPKPVKSNEREPIAIIGMSGRYPQAKTLDEFWQNLKSGKDCITEIPEDRWSIEDFYLKDRQQADHEGKSYSKWGGFLEDVAYFDPLFFSISPREATNIDPQERLFLEACWEVLEDGGYTRKKLAEQHQNKVGVFAGVTKNGYNLYGQQSNAEGSHFHPLSSFSSIANRISYFMDFNGPSMPIDTMCSSSLTAIHEACEHIYHNNCEMAIAGGVNLYLHPTNYTDLCRHKMLSEDGKCRSFGRGGSGFVPGEGVGCVLLKPLSNAIADGDNIYALVKGTSINHGGKTSGYTVPNPTAQGDLIQNAISKAGVDARAISYIEAHGTGTELGDPIEITGLTQAFAPYTTDSQFCAIGSAKSNIGHLEASAGIAGVTKIVLQMKNKQLVPTLHVEELNPNINFEKTPFVVQKNLEEWKQPVFNTNGEINTYPRIAGVSSFGAGGANAHIIIEEYISDTKQTISDHKQAETFLIPISAKSKDSLKLYAQKLLIFLDKQELPLTTGETVPDDDKKASLEQEIKASIVQICHIQTQDFEVDEKFDEIGIEYFQKLLLKEPIERAHKIEISTNDFLQLDSGSAIASYILDIHQKSGSETTETPETHEILADIAFTLQQGREHMEERIAFTVSSLQEFKEKLNAYIEALEKPTKFYEGKVTRTKEELKKIASDETWQRAIKQCIAQNRWNELGNFWVNGIDLDWKKLYKTNLPGIVSLPTYGFSRKKYWVPQSTEKVSKPEPVRVRKETEAHSTSLNEKEEIERPMEKKLKTAIKISKEVVENFIKEAIIENLSMSLDLDIEDIDHDKSFADYGLDSILGVDLIHSINEALAIELETIKLFDYSSVNQLTHYVLAQYSESVEQLISSKNQHDNVPFDSPSLEPPEEDTTQVRYSADISDNQEEVKERDHSVKEPIAIVGMSGRFSSADNLDDLWSHLSNGDDLIEKVTRWDLDSIYNKDGTTRDTFCDSGSFVKDIDKFDPLFFNISGVEANYMDPQQRLFLEESWKALEDAGYAGASIKGSKSGVYVGCYGGDYQNHFSGNTPAQALWGTMGSVIPSRIAYYLDFKGPAISVDTSCSSSLVAIHLACKDLWTGETGMALAGGVFIQTTPRLYTFAEGAGMLSPEGRCKSFDQSADGFVPGEGAGVVVLKRLSDAVADGDHIHGVIQGTGTNQDGTTNGITAPSANSQERLLTQIYTEFNINPEHIQMVEAHGTGTKLGDPIEFSALTQAFRKFTNKKQYSALGSIKTNLGHTQYAAGVAGVHKILLSLKNEQIPPSLHFKEGNQAINFTDSPFFVNTSSKKWSRGMFESRTAVASSFGASGTNAHLVISEAPNNYRSHEIKPLYVIILSARSEQQLKQQAHNLKSYCETTPSADLGNISYTLSIGRKHMNHRLACTASNLQGLLNSLDEWIQTGSSEKVFDSLQGEKSMLGYSDMRNQSNEYLDKCLKETQPQVYLENTKVLALLYTQGADVSFEKLFDTTYSRVSLPTYPFEKVRYWVPEKNTSQEKLATVSGKNQSLINENTSDINQQSQKSILTGEEFYLKDHQVQGTTVLPGVVYLEIGRAAAVRLLGTAIDDQTSILLRDVVWIRPIQVEEPMEVLTTIVKGDHDDGIKYEIRSRAKQTEEWSLNSKGQVAFIRKTEPTLLDIKAWQEYCSDFTLSADQCYEAIQKMGIHHGVSLQGVTSIQVGNNHALAQITLPVQAGDLTEFVMHPSMLDSAIQASIGLFINEQQDTAVPFGIEEVTVLQPCTTIMWALIGFNAEHISTSKIQKLDIDLFDEKGSLCIQMKGYTSRVLENEPQIMKEASNDSNPTSHSSPDQVASLLLRPVFDGVTFSEKSVVPHSNDQIVILGGNHEQRTLLQEQYPKALILDNSRQYTITSLAGELQKCKTIDHIIWVVEEDQNFMLNEELLIDQQEIGVLLGFKLIKALIQLGYDSQDLNYTVITVQSQAINTEDTVSPAHASIHGLVGSMAKEYPNWKVRLVDMPSEENWSLKEVLKLPMDDRGNATVHRNGAWYRQQLLPIEDSPSEITSYKQNGVYVIIGGAGGIGRVWTDYMIRTYQAQVVWIGRRTKDNTIQAHLDVYRQLGGPMPKYISADANDKLSLESAYLQIKQQFGQINGLIHSAIVLLDQSLAKMDETRFRSSLEAKVNTSVRMAQVFNAEDLDFVMFFSSIQSFAKAPGQSNYAAGCTFKDAFAQYLRQHWSCAIKVMNWGYWGSVGIVASEAYQQRMMQVGLASIEAPEAMAALETLLASPVDQLALSKGTKAMRVEGINLEEQLCSYPETINSYVKYLEQNLSPQEVKVSEIKAKVGAQVKEMDGHLVRLLWGQLQAIGMFKSKASTIAQLKIDSGIPELYDRWLEESLTVLARYNYLTFDEVSCTVMDTTPIDLEAAWKDWELQKQEWVKDPNRKAQVLLVEATVLALPEILTGKKQATDIIFPNSSMKLVEGVYKNNAVADYFNDVLSDTLVDYVKARIGDDSNIKLRILEIGAGTGGTSAMVFPKLRPYQSHIEEYCYTDLSKAFLLHAKREYGPQNPYLDYQIFNVEKPLDGQSIKPDTYDIVIATNVLHATKNISNTMRNTKAALKKHGVLLLNELSDNVLFSHLTFGLLKGWWLYDDPDLRISGSPGLFPEVWKKVLENEGYQSVYLPTKSAHDMGQAIIVAESDGVARQNQPFHFEALPASIATAIPTEVLPMKQAVRTPEPVELEKPISVMHNAMASPQAVGVQKPESSIQLLTDKGTVYMKNLVAEILQISPQQIQAKEPLESYGIDSILVVQLTDALRKVLSNVSSTLFFEFQTIDALVDHFVNTQQEALMSLLGIDEKMLEPIQISSIQQEPATKKIANILSPPVISEAHKNRNSSPPSSNQKTTGSEQGLHKEDVAIIGLSGRYPQAENVNQFWDNIKSAKNCISEVPSDRWDWETYYDAEKGKKGSIYSKWGGFVDDIDKFDPLFFKISPIDAEKMDPQERLFLQEAYATIQDAGYTRENISADRKVGVFVGVMNGNYPIGAAYFSIANRVSYSLNFNGPSLAVDTACSSSLTAIHLAIESLHSGSCQSAIAGGVNLIVDPFHYQKLSELGMLSESDKCKSFGDNADGFVDGEGVGAVLLKPLSKAIADGDHIYGVIKASSLNHGGKTNGYTVPNPNAQGAMIKEAIAKAGMHPDEISYIEAHGTGTSLGDPIEIAGLSKAFSETRKSDQYCAVGSVKSNIGHTEAAAGIAGLTKVLLQMKHKQLAPSLHVDKTNPNIQFEETPFYVSKELKAWEAESSTVKAGISSFGAGGSNAHLIVESYDNVSDSVDKDEKTVVVVLSARNKEQLRDQVKNLSQYLQHTAVRLDSLTYTLQTGREEMDERLAIVVDSVKDLQNKLTEFIENKGQQIPSGMYVENAREVKKLLSIMIDDEDTADMIATWSAKGKHDKLASMWVKGMSIDWELLYATPPMRVSLPTYPFAKNRYWLTKEDVLPEKSALKSGSTVGAGSELIYNQLVWKPTLLDEQGNQSIELSHQDLLVLLESNGEDLWSQVEEIDEVKKATLLKLNYDTSHAELDEFGKIALKAFERFKKQILQYSKENFRVIVLAESGFVASMYKNSIMAMLKSIQLEHGHMSLNVISFDETSQENVVQILKRELANSDSMINSNVTYTSGGQHRHSLLTETLHPRGVVSPVFRDNEVVWVTGGLGGIALHVVEGWLKKGLKNAILIGRSVLENSKKENLLKLQTLFPNAKVIYYQGDVSDKAAMQQVKKITAQRDWKLKGVVHAAGIIRDSLVVNKTEEDFQFVMKPKVTGAHVMDDVTKDMDIEFFAVFSSIAALTPGSGQSDYACANAYLDHFAHYRNSLVNNDQRSGKTVSINWPHWKEGGMQFDHRLSEMMADSTGIISLESQQGVEAFDTILSQNWSQVTVSAVSNEYLKNMWIKQVNSTPETVDNTPISHQSSVSQVRNTKSATYDEALTLVTDTLKVPLHEIKRDTTLDELGIDSIAMMNLVSVLQDRFNIKLFVNELQRQRSISELINYVLKEFSDQHNSATQPDDDEKTLFKVLAEAMRVPLSELREDHTLEELGMDSITLMNIVNKLQGLFNIDLFVNELQRVKNVEELITYVQCEVREQHQNKENDKGSKEFKDVNSNGVANGQEEINQLIKSIPNGTHPNGGLENKQNKIAHIHPLEKLQETTEQKAKKTIVVLGTPRSGSTLLRIMLNNNPTLFAPPELYLLGYEHMKDRDESLAKGGFSFLKEGVVEAIQHLSHGSSDEVKKLVKEFETKELSISDMYRYFHLYLEENQYLVDKTPAYGEDLGTLAQAEEDLESPYYIYLYRHPLAVMGSLVKNRFHKMMNVESDPWKLAEEIWNHRNTNVLTFLKGIPTDRQIHIPYESLVAHPEPWMRLLCQKLKIDYSPSMILPYQNLDRSMVTGAQDNSLMIGDPNFLDHRSIDPSLADAWKKYEDKWEGLESNTKELATTLNYGINKPTLHFGIEELNNGSALLPAQKAHLAAYPDDPTWHIVLKMQVADAQITKKTAESNFHQLMNDLPTLRTKFKHNKGQWETSGYNQDTQDQVIWVNAKRMNNLTLEKRREKLQNQFRKGINLNNGKLFWVGIFALPDNKISILITVHHLVIDGYSLHQLISVLIGTHPLTKAEISSQQYNQYLSMLCVPSMQTLLKNKWHLSQKSDRITLPDYVPDVENIFGNEATYEIAWGLEATEKLLDWNYVAGALYTTLAEVTSADTVTIAHRLHRRNVFDNTVTVTDIAYIAGDIPITLQAEELTDRERTANALIQAKNKAFAGGAEYEMLTLKEQLKPVYETAAIRLNYQPSWGDKYTRGIKVEDTHTELYEPTNHKRLYDLDCIVRQVEGKKWKCIVRFNHKQYQETQIAAFVEKWKIALLNEDFVKVKRS